jgi:prophage regulatory protein
VRNLLAPLTLEDITSIAERLTISRSTIYAWVREGRFPPPGKLGTTSRWLASEVDNWICERIAERDE